MLRSSSPGDYSYDYTTPTTRSTSPLHFLNPAMAHLTHHSPCHSHRAAASAAAAADISRLLDPSYLPSTSSRAAHGSPTAVTAYVDPHGDLHDPDYRHFPISAPAYSHHHFNAQAKNVRRGASPRPHFDWEMDLDEHALDDEYEEEELHSKNLGSRYAATATSRSWSSNQSTRPRESSFSTMSMYSPTYYSPTGTASTLPTSYEDDSQDMYAESPFDDKEKKEKKGRRLSKGDKEKEKMKVQEKERQDREDREKEAEAELGRAQELKEKEEPRRSSFNSTRRSLSRHSRRRADVYDDEHREEEDHEEDEDEDDSAHLHPPTSRTGSSHTRGAEVEYVPTCTQSLRRQWQALALSFRFGVFRAQRRMMRRVASLR